MILGKEWVRFGIALFGGFAAASLACEACASPRAADAMSNVQEAPATETAKLKIIPVCVPIGLASYKGMLFVGNHWTSSGCGAPGQITVYNSKGQQISKRTITTDIYNPAGLAVDAKGDLYVADYTKQHVTVYDPTGKELKGKTLHTDTNYNPSGVQTDSRGNVWVANRNNNNITIGEIQIFHTDGTVTSFTSNLVYPVGIAFVPKNGDAWVANSETPNDIITTYDPTGNFLKAHPTPGFTPTYLFFGSGKFHVTDGLHSEIEFFTSGGKQTGSTITQGLALPYGIAPGAKGEFWVANVGFGGTNNGSSITEYSAEGTLICTITTNSCK
jgi:DNA-binding beta-propeller fold protein YncE